MDTEAKKKQNGKIEALIIGKETMAVYKTLKNRICLFFNCDNTDDNFIEICKTLKHIPNKKDDMDYNNNCVCGQNITTNNKFKSSKCDNIINIGSKCAQTLIDTCDISGLDDKIKQEFKKSLFNGCLLCKELNIKNSKKFKIDQNHFICKSCKKKNPNRKYKYDECKHLIKSNSINKCLECEEIKEKKIKYEMYLLENKNYLEENKHLDLVIRKDPENITFWFGKYKNSKLKYIGDKKYFKWCIDNDVFKNQEFNGVKYDNTLIRNYITTFKI